METILPYALAPWDKRNLALLNLKDDEVLSLCNAPQTVSIAVSSSAKNERVGFGSASRDQLLQSQGPPVLRFKTTAKKKEHSPYIAELEAIRASLEDFSATTIGRHITIISRSLGSLQVIRNPRQQSGQSSVIKIYKALKDLKERGNTVVLAWLPKSGSTLLWDEAKSQAKKSTVAAADPPEDRYRAKSTAKNRALAKSKLESNPIPSEVGKFTKALDSAFPGKHVRTLYDGLSKKDASILSQVRTNKTKLNDYLYKINAVDSDECACGMAKEDIKHVLFRCTKYNAFRPAAMWMGQAMSWGNLSDLLGGKPRDADDQWAPKMPLVKETLKFLRKTGRFEDEPPPQSTNY